jgi:hypothetical protein
MRVRALEDCFVNDPTIPYVKRKKLDDYREEDGAYYREGSVFDWKGALPLPPYLVPADMPAEQVPQYLAGVDAAEQKAREQAAAAASKAPAPAVAPPAATGAIVFPGDPVPAAETVAPKQRNKPGPKPKPKTVEAPSTV